MFNLHKKGRPIVKISGGKHNNKIIFCDETYDSDSSDSDGESIGGSKGSTFDYLNIKKVKGKFEPVPNTKSERTIIYCSGPSGSGKSYYCKLFVKNYIESYPKNDIYMFSKLTKDSSLDDIKKIKRIRIDDELINEPFEADDFKDCLVIFDDIDTLQNKDRKDELLKLQNDILQVGRHSRTSAFCTSHLANKGAETKIILGESHVITLFLSSGQNYNYLLEKYLGFDKKEIDVLKKLKSRWISFCRNFPQLIFTETEIFPRKSILNLVDKK